MEAAGAELQGNEDDVHKHRGAQRRPVVSTLQSSVLLTLRVALILMVFSALYSLKNSFFRNAAPTSGIAEIRNSLVEQALRRHHQL